MDTNCEEKTIQEYRCSCCNCLISEQQRSFSTLCGLCDTGRCQKPKEFHKLLDENKRLKSKLIRVLGAVENI